MIDSFKGEYFFLSNFYPCFIRGDIRNFPSVEHAYQAAKTEDWYEQDWFISGSPGEAKRLGQKVTLRDDWEEEKVGVMQKLLRKKFSDPELRRKLISTGEETLVEGNNWGDTFWGVCNSKGQNRLGKLLMEIREEL